MAKGFNISVDERSLKSLIDKVRKDSREKIAEVDAEIGAHAEMMATNAKNIVPVDTGRLKTSITAKKNSELDYTLVAGTDYAAYIEFGTGPYAASYVPTLSEEWQSIAKQFYVNGKGRMPARPYLYPSVEKYKESLTKVIESIIND